MTLTFEAVKRWVLEQFYSKREYIRVSRGSTDANRPVIVGSSGTLDTTLLPANGVTNAQLADMAQATVKGRAAAAGTGDPTDLTAAQLVTILTSADGAGSLLDADTLDALNSTAFAILAGQSGGQTLNGDTASGGNLTLHSTAHATKGKILLGTASAYDQANDRIGVGTQSPTYHLHLKGSTWTQMALEYPDGVSGFAEVDFKDSTSGNLKWGFGVTADSYSPSNLFYIYQYRNAAETATSAYRLVVDDTGNIGVGTSTPAISDGTGVDVNGKVLRLRTTKTPSSSTDTGNTGEICWDSSYIYTATGTNAWKKAPLLDFSPSSWTPTLAFGGGSTGITYNARAGRYTRIGDMVVATCYIYLSSKGSSTGAVTITGLPVTAANVSSVHYAVSVYANALTGVSGALMGYVLSNTSVVSLSFLGTGTATALNDTHVQNTSDILVTATYLAA